MEIKTPDEQNRRNSSLVRKQKKKYIGINRCDLSIITITLLHKKELATMKPSTSMMSSPTSVAIAGRGTMDEAMANTSFSKVCLLTPKLKTQCCYHYKADECIPHRQYKIEQRSQIQAPQLDIRIWFSEARLHSQAFILYTPHKTTNKLILLTLREQLSPYLKLSKRNSQYKTKITILSVNIKDIFLHNVLLLLRIHLPQKI